jgi:hypothetical protein
MGKSIANYVFVKGLIRRTYKRLKNFSSEQPNNPTKKWAIDLNQVWWCMSVNTSTWESEVGGFLRPAWDTYQDPVSKKEGVGSNRPK